MAAASAEMLMQGSTRLEGRASACTIEGDNRSRMMAWTRAVVEKRMIFILQPVLKLAVIFAFLLKPAALNIGRKY